MINQSPSDGSRAANRPGIAAALFAVFALVLGVVTFGAAPAGAQSEPPGQIVVSNAFTDSRFVVWVDSTIEIDAKSNRFLSPVDLTPGDHLVELYNEGGEPTTSTPIASRMVSVESGEAVSYTIHPSASGTVATTVFPDDTSKTGASTSRLVVRHVAEFGPVDVQLRPKASSPMASEGTSDEFTLSNGQQAVIGDIVVADNLVYELLVYPSGSTDPIIIDTEVVVEPGIELTIAIAGNPPVAETDQDPESLLQREADVGALPPPAISLVNGFSMGQYDFYVNGELSRGGIEPKRRSGLLQPTNSMGENISEGTYTVEVYPAEGGPAQGGTPSPIASTEIGVCDGRSYSLAVHPDAGGDETLTFFENDVRQPSATSTRVTVRHIAEEGDLSVDVSGNGENSSPASTANFTLANGGEEVLDDFLVNDYQIDAYRAGTTQRVAANDNAEAEGGAPIVAYIVGSPPQPTPPGNSLIYYEVATIPGAPAPGTDCAQGGTSGPIDPSSPTTPTDPSGPSAGENASKFVPITPNRVLDTRAGGASPIASGASVTVDASALADVPADATAVAVNLTAAQTQARGFLSATPLPPTGDPELSNLNFSGPGQVRAATNTVPLADDGTFNVFVAGGAHVLADITGYYISSDATTDGRFVPIEPDRAFDTRDASGPSSPLASAEPLTFDIDSTTGVPESGVSALVLNVTSARAADGGFVEVRPGGTGVTGTSSLNFTSGPPVANQVIVPVGAGGTVTFEASTTTDLIVDVFGFFTDDTAESSTTGLFVPVEPLRAVDTRVAPAPQGNVGPDGSITVDAAAALGVSPSDMIAVDATLAAVGPVELTFLSAYPTGTARPDTSVVNVPANDVRANSVYVSTGSGAFDVYSFSSTDVIADLSGYFTS